MYKRNVDPKNAHTHTHFPPAKNESIATAARTIVYDKELHSATDALSLTDKRTQPLQPIFTYICHACLDIPYQ